MKKVFTQIPVEWLQPSRYQPRINFAKKALEELAQSIRNHGLIEPLAVREIARERYEIIAGERRWRAAMVAGLKELPCIISDYNDSQAAAITLVENIQRQDLNLIEEAQGYRRLMDEFYFHQDEIASLLGKSRSHVANSVRLLTLCDAVKERIKSGQLSPGHARVLVGLTPFQQMLFVEQIESNEWSVRQLEKKVKALKTAEPPKTNPKKDRDVERLQAQLAEQIGAPVQIVSDNSTGGWLQVKFFDNDTLAGLLDKMGLRYD